MQHAHRRPDRNLVNNSCVTSYLSKAPTERVQDTLERLRGSGIPLTVVPRQSVELGNRHLYLPDLLVGFQGDLIAVVVGPPRAIDATLRAELNAAGVARVVTIRPNETVDPDDLEAILISRVLMAPAA